MKARPKAGFIAVNTLLLWAATAISAFALWPIYRSESLIIMIVGATIVASAIAILGAVFRWMAPIVMGATVVAFVAFGVQLAVPSEAIRGLLPSVSGLADLVSGVAIGWKQLLTISLPVGQYQALLVPFYTLIMVLTVIALSIALRTRFGDAAVVGPGILFLTATAFGSQTPTLPIASSLGLLAILLLWIVWRRWYSRRTAIRLLASHGRDSDAPIEVRADTRFVGFRTLFAAVLILVLAAGTAIGAAAALPPSGTRTVLRTTITQPFEPRNYASPLSGFRTYWEKPKTSDVLLTVRGLPKDSRIRIATLDTYDGVVYSVGSAAVNAASGSFTRVPFEYDQAGVKGRHISLTVTNQDYSGVWLPTVGQLEKVAFSGPDASKLQSDFFYNNTTGTAVDLGKFGSGDSYTLSAIVPSEPSLNTLKNAVAGSADLPSLTTLPAELSTALNSYVGKATTQGEKLVAMIETLKKNGYVSHGVGKEASSASGHSVERINQLLTATRMVGDAEQYSVTAALMARQLGFPARVVMGFVPQTTGTGTSEIKGKDVSAWIEVDTAQYGWVTIDPNPPTRPIPTVPPKNPNQVAQPQTVVLPPVTLPNPNVPQPNPDSQQHSIAPPNQFLIGLFAVLQVLAWVLLAVVVVLSPFLVILLAKSRRRKLRRSAPTTLGRISGGWQEFEDSVVDHGIEPPVAATRSEVAMTVGGTRSAVLAAVTDRATFGPGDPDPGEVDLVWRSVGELTAALDAGKTRWERLRAQLSLRSLRGQSGGRYSVSYLFKPKGSSS
ncbi:MAG TPA: transglutaminase-like domain-containing protein [Galbitalea sp.]|nr:transglutaminase-like domain-containing protein [Galbitalea sp.]